MSRGWHLAAAMVALLAPAGGRAEDLHILWDQRCGACHGHAGQFTRETLKLVDGHLQDRSGRDVETFLVGHNGGYSPEHVAAIVTMLKAQAGSTDLFQRRCGECHDTAAQLVRERVVRRDGVLVGRETGRSLAVFLRHHGDLEDGETAPVLDALDRIEREVHHP